MSGTGTEIVVVSLEAWNEVWRRNQYLVAEMLRDDPGLRVLFVEPPADPLHDLRRGRRPAFGVPVRQLPAFDGVEPGRVHTLRPTKFLPRRIAPGGDRRRARSVERAARRLGFTAPTLWINDLTGVELLETTDWPALYDVTDDWLAADRAPAEHRRLADAEQRVLTEAAAVTVCSPALATSKGTDRPATLLTNGVDVERYVRPVPRPADLPTGRTALYVGTLHADRLDVDLCVRTAEALGAAATLTLVGPSALGPADEVRLRSAGVVILGPRAWNEVPAYLQHADALVVPHVVDRFTDSLDPIKLYEYRAVGKPVVSTPVAGFRDSTDRRVVAVDRTVFPEAVLAASRRAVPARAVPADLPTWTGQAARMAEVVATVRTERRRRRNGAADGPAGVRETG